MEDLTLELALEQLVSNGVIAGLYESSVKREELEIDPDDCKALIFVFDVAKKVQDLRGF